MREVTGSTWTFQIIIIFILIFACFLTLVLSYSKAYRIKNRLLTVVEKYEGFTDDSTEIIHSFMVNQGYKTKSYCPDEWIGARDIYSASPEYGVNNTNDNYYCFKENYDSESKKIYYDIMVFYRFNLPVIGDVMTYRIEGQTMSFLGSEDRIEG